jgi:DNA-binding Lrp family transcriptional regulator
MGKPMRKVNEPLDDKTKEAIRNSIFFLQKSGFSDDKIFDKIRIDFDVSTTEIKEISGKLPFTRKLDLEFSNLSKNQAFAYVLIICDTGYENEIISKLIKFDNVSEAKGIFGEYDIFVKLDAISEEQMAEALSKIRKIPHITSTNTLTSIPSQGGK